MFDLDRNDSNGKRKTYFNIKVRNPRPGKKETCFLNFEPVEPEESVNGCF